jgi:hypothetical protein
MTRLVEVAETGLVDGFQNLVSNQVLTVIKYKIQIYMPSND